MPFWISPVFILPRYQGKGIAQMVIQLIEVVNDAVFYKVKYS
ncbi:hypothetical protein BABA_03724 [Neobacillus bataviensis LMG 21833]|uniref:N-acetyltransferase domain-containing protein n=1 Tax=Neobacillus bataviensis LMG 21833 TaxID=1117379 RepID=K6CIF2_9BACI|nr:hypothetical protein BABA_03724 [Neobacillus bataviensis LMG 21833]